MNSVYLMSDFLLVLFDKNHPHYKTVLKKARMCDKMDIYLSFDTLAEVVDRLKYLRISRGEIYELINQMLFRSKNLNITNYPDTKDLMSISVDLILDSRSEINLQKHIIICKHNNLKYVASVDEKVLTSLELAGLKPL